MLYNKIRLHTVSVLMINEVTEFSGFWWNNIFGEPYFGIAVIFLVWAMLKIYSWWRIHLFYYNSCWSVTGAILTFKSDFMWLCCCYYYYYYIIYTYIYNIYKKALLIYVFTKLTIFFFVEHHVLKWYINYVLL